MTPSLDEKREGTRAVELKFDEKLRADLVAHKAGTGPMLDEIEDRLSGLFKHYVEPDLLPVGPAKDALPFDKMVKVYLAHAQMSLGRRLGTLLEDFVQLANTRRPDDAWP